jgi:hypothetical protein
MEDLGTVAQLLVSILVGVGSGLGAAIMTNRHANRRYHADRMDALIPAARRMAELFEWQGESYMGIRQSGPPDDEFRKAQEVFNRYRHDLPPEVQGPLNEMDKEVSSMFDYGDAMVAASARLLKWVEEETNRRHRRNPLKRRFRIAQS